MSIKITEEVPSVQDPKEFDALLEAYKLQNPAKYAEKLAKGEFEKYRIKIGAKPTEETKEVVKESKGKK